MSSKKGSNMRTIATIAVLGLSLGWTSGALSESALIDLSESAPIDKTSKKLTTVKSEKPNQWNSSLYQSRKLNGANLETLRSADQDVGPKAGQQVDTKLLSMASGSTKTQQPNVLSATKLPARDLLSISTPSLAKNKAGEAVKKSR